MPLIRAETTSIWTPVSFLNGWVNYGSGLTTAAYCREGDRIYLKGVVKSGTIGATIFFLPVGYRPSERMLFPGVSSSSGVQVHTRIDVLSNGEVRLISGGNEYLSLDAVNFRL